MKRKLPLFMAMLMMVSLLCAPVAYAAPSPDQGTIDIQDPDVPLVDIPEVRIPVDSDGVVPVDELLDAAAQVEAGDAVRITILPKDGAIVSEVTLPKAGIDAVISAGAELKVETSYGKAIFPASALSNYDGDIVLVIEEEEDVFDNEKVLHVYLVCNGVTYYNWSGDELTLYVPAVGGDFVVDNSYSVEQYDKDGNRIRTYVGLCVEEEGKLWVVIAMDNNYLGYFVAQPDAVADEDAVVVDPTIVVSPLAAKTTADNTNGVWASVQNWFDSVANQFMKLFGL